jgi:enoyl-CoA hydratase/carnithine racemase
MVRRERLGNVEVVRLDAPPLHLLGHALVRALDETMRDIAQDPPAVAVLHCTGAGANVKELAQLDTSGARTFITALHHSIRAVRDLEAPVIGVVDGVCFGAHLELAAACDLRIASPASRFGMPEVKVGLPSVIEACLLFAICGLGEASRLVYEGDVVDAPQALRMGLINRVAGDVEDASRAWALRLASVSSVALRQQKRVVREWTAGWYDHAVRTSIDHFEEAFAHPETLDALRAFGSNLGHA